MAETDVLYEFGREPGFSCSVFDPERSHMLHNHLEITKTATSRNTNYLSILLSV